MYVCACVWSWLALQFALQDLKTALIAMLQVYTQCLYGTVWYTANVCVCGGVHRLRCVLGTHVVCAMGPFVQPPTPPKKLVMPVRLMVLMERNDLREPKWRWAQSTNRWQVPLPAG